MNIAEELRTTLSEVDVMLTALRRMPPQLGAGTVYGNVDTNGRPLMADLLVTRASILIALANLPEDT